MREIKKTKFITKKQANALRVAASELTLTDAYGQMRRAGAAGVNNLSRYQYLRENRWSSELREAFAAAFDEQVQESWLEISILRLPENGLLDKQTAWADKVTTVDDVPSIAMFAAVALADKQKLILGGKSANYSAGDAVFFTPDIVHEIKKTNKENMWLVLMLARPAAERYLNE